MLWEQKVEYAAVSDIGFRRRNNQDAYVVQTASDRTTYDRRGHLFLVADGMGGHAVGELASKIAADTIPHAFFKSTDELETALQGAITDAHRQIHERGEQNRDFARMGTTCTTLVLSPRGALVGHVGDSRCYRIRGERIEQLTFDHSLQWELLKQGRMSPEDIFLYEPRNVITRSLGPQPQVEVDLEGPHPVRPRDVYILCSDGLSALVADDEIGMIARHLDPADACRMLVDLANLRGGSDNITVVVARVGLIPGHAAPPLSEPLPRTIRPGAGFTLSALLAVIVFLIGNVLMALERPVLGFLLEGIAVIAVGATVLAGMRWHRRYQRRAALPEMTPGSPYRRASAAISAKFVNDVASLEDTLQRSALEEDWSINWTDHNQHYAAAKSALGERRYADALREYARSIHVLMLAIQQQRKQRDLANRWGVKAPATPRPENRTPLPAQRRTPRTPDRGNDAGADRPTPPAP